LLDRLIAEVAVDLHVMASCPRWLWPSTLEGATVSWRDAPCDVGVVEFADMTVDEEGTAHALERWHETYPATLEREARRLAAGGFDLVLGDVPPLAFDAAGRAGLASVALANFSWDWIYQQMGLAEAAAAAAASYRRAGVLLELEPCAPMDAFPQRVAVGVLGRPAGRPRDRVRDELGVEAGTRLVLVALRAPGVCGLPAPRSGLCYAVPGVDVAGLGRTDVVEVPSGVSFVDLLSAADAVVAKPGYGIIGDSTWCGAPLLYTKGRGFPESRYLEAWLARRPATRTVTAAALAAGSWSDEIGELIDGPRPPLPADDTAALAVRTLREAGGF